MRRKPSHTPTGRLKSLRLFSTLLPLTLKVTRKGEEKAHTCAIDLVTSNDFNFRCARDPLSTDGQHEGGKLNHNFGDITWVTF